MQTYNPLHDPLVDSIPGTNQEYSPTYWVATAGLAPPNDGLVPGDIEADVVIVGSGATGIATALYLAQEHGIQAVILEANQTACIPCSWVPVETVVKDKMQAGV
jgi:hypothetical protein